jgi:hypothetical protein
MLRQLQTIEVPSWLTNLTPEAIKHAPLPLHELLHESLFYPSCGFDGDPIKHLGGNVLSFVYVDYGLTRDDLVSNLYFRGYDNVGSRFVTVNELMPDHLTPSHIRREDGDPLRYSEYVQEPFCVWSIFQRRITFPSTHGPFRFSMLFICAEGVAAFHALYITNLSVPKVVAVIQPGHAFGHNWTDFTDPEQVLARVVLSNPAGQPEMILYGGIGSDRASYASPCWPTYKFLKRQFRKTGGGTVGVWAKNLCDIVPRKTVHTE